MSIKRLLLARKTERVARSARGHYSCRAAEARLVRRNLRGLDGTLLRYDTYKCTYHGLENEWTSQSTPL